MRRITRSASVVKRTVEGVAESEVTLNIVRNVKEFAANADVHLPPPAVNRVKKSKETKVKVSPKDKVTGTRTHDTIDCLTPTNTLVLTGGNQAVNTRKTSPGPCDAIRTREVDGDEGKRDIKKDIKSYSYSSLAAPKGRPANSNSDGGSHRNESPPTPTMRKKSLRSYSVAPTCRGRGQQQEVADNFYKLDLLTETGDGASPSPRTSISNITDVVNSGEDGFSASTSKPTSTPTVSTAGISRQKHCASTTKPKLPKHSDLPTDSDQQEIGHTVEADLIDPAKIGPGTSDAAQPRARKKKHKLPKNSAVPTDSDQQEIVRTVEADFIDPAKIGPGTSDAARPGARKKKHKLPKSSAVPTDSDQQEIVRTVEADFIDPAKIGPGTSDAARPRVRTKKRLPKNSALPTDSDQQEIVRAVEADLIDPAKIGPSTSDAARPRAREKKHKLPKSSVVPTDSDQQEIGHTVEVDLIDLTKADPGTSDAAQPRARKEKLRLPKISALPGDLDQQGIEIVRTVEADFIDSPKIGPGNSDATQLRRCAPKNKHKLSKSSAFPTDSDQQEIAHTVEVDLIDLTKADSGSSDAARRRARKKKPRLPKNSDLASNSDQQEIIPSVEYDLIDIPKIDPGTSDVPRPRRSASTNKHNMLSKSSVLPTDSDPQEIIRTAEVDLIDLTKADPGTSDAARPRVRSKKRLPKNSALPSDSDQQGIEIVRTVEVGWIELEKIGPSTSDAAEDGDARTDINGVSSPAVSSIQKLRSLKVPGRPRRNEATGKTSLTISDSPQNISNYTLSCSAEEDHRKQIYGVAFNWFLKPDQPLIFATVGSNRISIYECVKAAPPLLDPKSKPDLNHNQQGSIDDSPLKLLQVYEDFDDDEVFYTCAWTIDDYVGSYLAAAGLRGVIRIFSPADGECVKDFVGHTGAVNSLSVHPLDFNLLLSSSQDHSIRLWNIKTNVCVAIFSGESGHRDEVIDAGFNLSGNRFASGGLDHSVKVWLLDRDDIKSAIRNSYTWQAQIVERGRVKACKPFPTFLQHFPDFTSRDIHHDYVDCVKWFGEFVISKSVANKIVCWKGGDMFQKWAHVIDQKIKKHTVIHEWKVEKCESWFLRFGFDGKQKKLALGNEIGEIYVFEMIGRESEDGPSKIKPEVLRHPGCTSVVRQTAWSRDGKVLICVCDDSTVWRWDYSEK